MESDKGGNRQLSNETDSATAGSQQAFPAPETLSAAKNTDAFFAAELNKLTMEERDEVLHDVHGVSDVMQEDSDFISRRIVELTAELDSIPPSSCQAYLLAKQQNESYVMNEKFLLMFLRADRFHIKTVAARFVAFFQGKLELFGPDKVGRDILYTDLSEDDKACLHSGYAQVLNGRDRSGRAIFCLLPMIRNFKTLENRMRSIYMVLMFALQDVETQKRGIVGLAYNVGRGRTTDREAVWKAAKMVSIIPLRFTAVHYCFDDEKLRMLFSVAMFVFNKNARIRCRLHFGTDMECIYTLMTFGIPSDILPVGTSGEKKIEAHEEYVRRMRNAHEMVDNVDRIILPGKFDVLLGRGKPLQKHHGNLHYHFVIEGYHDRYEKAMKLEKTQIAKFIVDTIQELGGRFLKQDEAGWVEIDDEAARTKVSHTFRNHRIAARTAVKKAAAADSPVLDGRSKGNKGIGAMAGDQRMRSDADSPFELDNFGGSSWDQKRRKIAG